MEYSYSWRQRKQNQTANDLTIESLHLVDSLSANGNLCLSLCLSISITWLEEDRIQFVVHIAHESIEEVDEPESERYILNKALLVNQSEREEGRLATIAEMVEGFKDLQAPFFPTLSS
ncbi:unnamed protein product [Dovyalis caffra]|uniref:Uncharacterized protein n=1 Tax=Dovyalis caffra TaxID=77055 RepID=A0AAV1QVP4_9ROSI|nr:unnamed protein product [Dovyalis caffra]